MTGVEVSFIIPALNEEEHIAGVLDSVSRFAPRGLVREVIMVDNGSRDNTVAIAAGKNAICLASPGCSISELRNLGALRARGDILIFLDADVYLTPGWGERIGAVLELLRQQPFQITGSLYGISEAGNWIERVWFAPHTTRSEVRYINGGHMIMHRQLFSRVEGFAPHLETGEDVEFCERARTRGVTIENDPALKVVHAGYPRTVRCFFARERWHGRGDFYSLATVYASKPALISLVNLSMLMVCLIGLLMPLPWYLPLLVYAMFLACVSLVSAIHRQAGRIDAELAVAMFLYMVYFTARTASLVDAIRQRIVLRCRNRRM